MKRVFFLLLIAGALLTLSGCWPMYHHMGGDRGYHHNYYDGYGNRGRGM